MEEIIKKKNVIHLLFTLGYLIILVVSIILFLRLPITFQQQDSIFLQSI